MDSLLSNHIKLNCTSRAPAYCSRNIFMYLIGEKKVGEKWLNYLQMTRFFPDFLFPDQYFSPIFFTWQRIYRDSFQLLLLLFFFSNLFLKFIITMFFSCALFIVVELLRAQFEKSQTKRITFLWKRSSPTHESPFNFKNWSGKSDEFEKLVGEKWLIFQKWQNFSPTFFSPIRYQQGQM